MGKILYVTNCIGGGLDSWEHCKHRSSSWTNRQQYPAAVRPPDFISKNIVNFLIELGHDVSIYSYEGAMVKNEQEDLMVRLFFHKDAKLHKNKELDEWTLGLSYSDRTHELLPFINLLSMKSASEAAGFDDFDLVIYGSFFEYASLTQRQWYEVFKEAFIHNAGIIEAFKQSIPIEEILSWIDSPLEQEYAKYLGTSKPLIPPGSVEKLKESLKSIPNFYTLLDLAYEQRNNWIMNELVSAKGPSQVEHTIDSFFPKTACEQARFHCNQIIPIEKFDNLDQIKKARKSGVIDAQSLFSGFESRLILCPPSFPNFDLCENKITFRKQATLETYKDYFYGVTKITNKGNKELAENIDDLLFGSSLIKLR